MDGETPPRQRALPATVIRHADLPVTPWRNGLGTTREVAFETGPQGFLWRVSIADVVAAGPFSTFEDIDRVLLVIAGAGLILDVDGQEHRLGLHDALAFDGEKATSSRPIDGPTQDLNLMTLRGEVTGRLEVAQVAAGDTFTVPEASTSLLVALTPLQARVGTTGLSLDSLDAVALRAPLTVIAPATVAVVTITPAGSKRARVPLA